MRLICYNFPFIKVCFHIVLPLVRCVGGGGGAYVSLYARILCALVRSFEFYNIIMQQRKAVMSNRIVKVTITFIRNILFQKYRKSLHFEQALSNEWTHFDVFFSSFSFSLSLSLWLPFHFDGCLKDFGILLYFRNVLHNEMAEQIEKKFWNVKV